MWNLVCPFRKWRLRAVSMEPVCDYTSVFWFIPLYLSLDPIFPHIITVSEHLQKKKYKNQSNSRHLPFLLCQGKMDCTMLQLKLLLLAMLGDICMNYSWAQKSALIADTLWSVLRTEGPGLARDEQLQPTPIAGTRHLHLKLWIKQVQPSARRKSHILKHHLQ